LAARTYVSIAQA